MGCCVSTVKSDSRTLIDSVAQDDKRSIYQVNKEGLSCAETEMLTKKLDKTRLIKFLEAKKQLEVSLEDDSGKDTRASTSKHSVPKNLRHVRALINANENIYSKYDLKDEIIGTGVSGVVRLGLDRHKNIQYAIKCLNKETTNIKKDVMNKNEVETYLMLDHPSIVRLVDIFEEDTKIYLVMELSNGSELYDHLLNIRRFPEQEAKKLILQMLECINYCHHKHICHRDLKLENWVFKSKERQLLKLIDFGFGRVFSSVIPMTAMHGTIYYVSPEVMDGCYREKCDIWSLGVLTYMLLSGTPPFNGKDDYQILIKIKNNMYNFKGSVWNKISPNAKNFIKLLLQPNPTNRPTAAEAMKHAWINDANYDSAILQCPITNDTLKKSKNDLLNIVKYANTFTHLEKIFIYTLGLGNLTTQWNHFIFRYFDTDRTGILTSEEFIYSFVHLWNSYVDLNTIPDVAEIYDKLNLFNADSISYTEFVSATDFNIILSDKASIVKLAKLFADTDQQITQKSFMKIANTSVDNCDITSIIKEDESISVNDFVNNLIEKKNSII